MVTYVPIVSPKVLGIQHLQIVYDFSALDIVQIFKSLLMIINWYKPEIAQFSPVMFFKFITRELM